MGSKQREKKTGSMNEKIGAEEEQNMSVIRRNVFNNSKIRHSLKPLTRILIKTPFQVTGDEGLKIGQAKYDSSTGYIASGIKR